MKKLSKIEVTKERSAIGSSCLGSEKDSKQCESSHGLDRLVCPYEQRVFPRCSWGVTSVQNFTDFNAGRNQDYHLVFSVRHEVSHDASSFVPLCSGYTAEEVFRLRSADNWRPQKVIKEVSFTHYSQQTTYVKLIKNSLSSLGNF